MGFFSKNDKEYVLLFDVGNGSIGVAVAEISDNKNILNKAKLVEVYRETIPFQEHLRFDHFTKTVAKSIESAAKRVQAELKYPIEKAYLILASPWYASQTRVVNLRKSESFTFTEELFAEMIKKAMMKEKGSQKPGKEIVATITKTQAQEIAKTKMEDLNTTDIEMATHIVMGTARSMWVEVK